MDYRDNRQRWAESHQVVHFYAGQWCTFTPALTVLGMAICASEAETFWTEFLRSLARRGLRGVKLVISDDHKGLKAAATRILGATWQRCRVHFARNLLAHAGGQGWRVVWLMVQGSNELSL